MTDLFSRLIGKAFPGSTLIRAWPLVGGISAQVTAMEFVDPDNRLRKALVRQYGARDLEYRPHVAAEEFRLLQVLRARAISVPEPYYCDESCTILTVPYIITELLRGKPDFSPSDLRSYLGQMASSLARIHEICDGEEDLSFLPRITDISVRAVRDMSSAAREPGYMRDGRRCLQEKGPSRRTAASTLLHGDFWPGNILWADGCLSGVIDWEDAAVGDPVADLSNCRLEVLWRFGADAMQAFTDAYLATSAIDVSDLSYWDLYAALRLGDFEQWNSDDATRKSMREKHRWFTEAALCRGRSAPAYG